MITSNQTTSNQTFIYSTLEMWNINMSAIFSNFQIITAIQTCGDNDRTLMDLFPLALKGLFYNDAMICCFIVSRLEPFLYTTNLFRNICVLKCIGKTHFLYSQTIHGWHLKEKSMYLCNNFNFQFQINWINQNCQKLFLIFPSELCTHCVENEVFTVGRFKSYKIQKTSSKSLTK